VQYGAHIHSAASTMYNNKCSSLVKPKICLALNFLSAAALQVLSRSCSGMYKVVLDDLGVQFIFLCSCLVHRGEF